MGTLYQGAAAADAAQTTRESPVSPQSIAPAERKNADEAILGCEPLLFTAIRLPGRLSSGQTAALLGFRGHDIATLCRARLLRPLGAPAANAPKYFASLEIEKLAADRQWLDSATNAVTEHWKQKNGAQSGTAPTQPARKRRRSRYAQ